MTAWGGSLPLNLPCIHRCVAWPLCSCGRAVNPASVAPQQPIIETEIIADDRMTDREDGMHLVDSPYVDILLRIREVVDA